MTDISKCNRISIIGHPGSGKSTLAKQLGEILGLPVWHCDLILFKPDRTQDTKAASEEIIQIASQDKWIIEGTYKRTLEYRFAVSDVVIYLNFTEDFCLQSIMDR